MFKKAVLMTFAAMLIVFGASVSFALQIDGLVSGTDNPALPAGIQSSINPGGLGDALLYGYYNVRGNLNLFNIVNTSTTDGVKARIVFRNARNSKEVLDFSICLSKGDEITMYLLDDGTQGHIYDLNSVIPGNTTVTGAATPFPVAGIPFKSGTYGPITVSADDTREGYFEVVGLSTIPGYDRNSSTTSACFIGGPPDSNCIQTATDCNDWVKGIGDVGYNVPDILFGHNDIVDLTNLTTFSYNATAVADASLVAFDVPSGSEESISDAIGRGRSSAIGCNEADYIFTKSNVISPYDLLSQIGGNTALIVTFPTRFTCHSDPNDLLFDCKTNDSVVSPTTCLTYCTNIKFSIWDDNEDLLTGGQVSPSPGSCLQYETNVINFGGSSIWNSPTVAVSISTGSFTLGWANMDIGSDVDVNHATTYGGDVTSGVPLVAYTTQTFIGGDASYLVPAIYKTNITVAP